MKLELTIGYPKDHNNPKATGVTFEETMTDELVVVSKKLLGPLLTAMLKMEEAGEEAYAHVKLRMTLEWK